MFEILNKQILANSVKRLDVYAPGIAKRAKPGQFVSVCPEEGIESIPLTVVDTDLKKGTVALIFQEVGNTTIKLGSMAIKESLFSILGPLGIPAQIPKKKNVVCIATGIGAAQMLPIARGFRNAGNKVFGILGAKTKRSLMVESQMRLACNRILIATNDGSYERKGQATDILKDVIAKQKIKLVYAIGNAEMMEMVCSITKEKKIETRVHLTPVMVDCMGMCGSCRVRVDDKVVLACLDGPEFDGHKVDFEDYKIRIKAFEETEQWQHRQLESSQKKSEQKILTRFLSGILKN